MQTQNADRQCGIDIGHGDQRSHPVGRKKSRVLSADFNLISLA